MPTNNPGSPFFADDIRHKIPSQTVSLDPVHGFNVPVAFSTGHPFSDVTLVIEKNEFRDVVNLYPRDWRFRLKILMLLSYFRVIGNNVLVTIEALVHRGYPWKS